MYFKPYNCCAKCWANPVILSESVTFRFLAYLGKVFSKPFLGCNGQNGAFCALPFFLNAYNIFFYASMLEVTLLF